MPAQCRPEQLVFALVEGRSVVASFTGGVITSDAGALLLGATDRAMTWSSASPPVFRMLVILT